MAKKTAPAPVPEIKALSVPERAVVALGYTAESEKSLTELAAKSTHITEITNGDGYKQCHAARMVLKNTRLDIKERGETARDDATKFSKAVIAEEKRLVTFIESEEKRLQKLQEDYDAAIEAEKQRLIEAEQKRVERIQERIAELRGCQMVTDRDEPAVIAEHLADVQALPVDATFEEFEQQAGDAKSAGILRLTALFRQATERVEDAKRRVAEQAELEQLRKDKAERDERDRKAAAEEQARRDEIARVERNRLAAEAAAQKPAPVPCKGENCGTTDYTKHSAECIAEHERTTSGTDTQFESFSRQTNVTQPIVDLTAPSSSTRFAQIKPERPSFDQIVSALCFHYDVSEDDVRSWICENVVLSSEAA